MGKVDNLIGLKENIIMGHLIPAGTGFDVHRSIELERELLKDTSEEADASEGEEEIQDEE